MRKSITPTAYGFGFEASTDDWARGCARRWARGTAPGATVWMRRPVVDRSADLPAWRSTSSRRRALPRWLQASGRFDGQRREPAAGDANRTAWGSFSAALRTWSPTSSSDTSGSAASLPSATSSLAALRRKRSDSSGMPSEHSPFRQGAVQDDAGDSRPWASFAAVTASHASRPRPVPCRRCADRARVLPGAARPLSSRFRRICRKRTCPQRE